MSTSPTTKVYVDWGKLIQIVLIVTSASVLGALEVISGDAVIGILGAGAGYIFGNGKSVREGHLTTAPLIGRRPVDLSPEELAQAGTAVVIVPDEG